MAESKMSATAEPHKKARNRSPNYPAVGLENAVERVKKLWAADGKAGSPRDAAVKHIGFSSSHGQAMTVLSALVKFGLVEEKGGRILPTARAVDIITFAESHDRHRSAIKDAALKPSIYAELVNKFAASGQIPSDGTLRAELIADMGFNPKAVDGFVADFRRSLEFAGLLDGNQLLLSSEDANNPDADGFGEAGIKVGDVVQWTSQGIAQWRTPRKVLEIVDQDEEKYVRVEAGDGDKGGHVPLAQVDLAESMNTTHTTISQMSPRVGDEREPETMKRDVFALDNGQITVQWPESLSKDSFEDVKDWLAILERKIGRCVRVEQED